MSIWQDIESPGKRLGNDRYPTLVGLWRIVLIMLGRPSLLQQHHSLQRGSGLHKSEGIKLSKSKQVVINAFISLIVDVMCLSSSSWVLCNCSAVMENNLELWTEANAFLFYLLAVRCITLTEEMKPRNMCQYISVYNITFYTSLSYEYLFTYHNIVAGAFLE